MDIQEFHGRVRDIQETMRANGLPKAITTIYAGAGDGAVGVHVRPDGEGRGRFECFRDADPEQTIAEATAYAEKVIDQATRNDREVAAVLGLLPDGRLIPDYAEAAE